MQASFNLSYFFKTLKETITVILRKLDYFISKAYRPIALESTIEKVLESIVAEVISHLTESYELLPKEHYGGRPRQSAEDAMIALSESIHKA